MSTTDPAQSRRALTIVLTALLVDTIGFGIIVPVMPDLITHLSGLPLSAAARTSGWLMFVFASMQFLFGPVMGGLGDHFGRRPVVLFCMLAFGIDYFVMAVSPTLTWLFVSRALAGVAGALFVPATAYIADITPPDRRAQNFGLMGAMFGLGFIIGPAVGGLLGSFGPHAPFYAAGSLALLNAACGFFLLPESLPAERRRAFDLTRSNPLGTLLSLARKPGVAIMLIAWFPWMLAHQVYPSTWAFFAKLRFQWSDGLVGASLAYAGLTMAVAQAFLIRRIIPAIGERRAIVLGLTIGAASFMANAFAMRPWIPYVVFTLGMLQGMVFPSMNATLSRIVPATEQGELSGGIACLTSISSIIGPPMLTGALSHFTREGASLHFPEAAFLVASVLALVSLSIVTVFARGVFARAMVR